MRRSSVTSGVSSSPALRKRIVSVGVVVKASACSPRVRSDWVMNETVQYSLLSRQEWTTLADMDRRAHYLEVALRLFLQHGFNGVSMDHLVAEAGGSKATLYRYFDSKEALFEAIIDDVAAGAVNSAGRDRWDEVELEDGLRQLGRATARSALDPRTIHMLRLALGEQARFPELARTLFEHGPRRTYARLREFLAAQGRRRTDRRPRPPDRRRAVPRRHHRAPATPLGPRPPTAATEGDRRARRSSRPHVQRGVPGARVDGR